MATLAHAQSASASAGPDDSQYVDRSPGVAVEGCTAATIKDGVEAMGETAGQGTDAINDTLGSPTTGALASYPLPRKRLHVRRPCGCPWEYGWWLSAWRRVGSPEGERDPFVENGSGSRLDSGVSVPRAGAPEPGAGADQPRFGTVRGEGAETFAESAERGTDAVNDAMAGAASSSASPAASGEVSGATSVSPVRATSSNDGGGDARAGAGGAKGTDTGEGLGSIEELPDTGGAPPAALIPGVLLVALGLMVRAVLKPWANRDT